MEARELRIGNILQGGIVVDSITLNGINCYVDTEGYLMEEYASHQLYGEPLSEVWLKRFGFEKPDNSHIIEYQLTTVKLCFLTTDEHYQLEYLSGLVTIQYVHQLQNLYFALTGTELTLNP